MNILSKFYKFLWKIVRIFIIWQIILRIVRKNYRFPVPAFVGKWLDSDFRRSLQPPQQIIERSGIRPGMTVLEVGCGSGAYTTFVARAVGENGKVYALDIQPEMLEQIHAKLQQPENQDIHNIELVCKSAYELPFDDNSLDLVYLITVLQEIPDRQQALSEIYRVLKPNGILAVSELLLDPDYSMVTTTARDGKAACFQIHNLEGNFWTYTITFRKPA